MEPSMPNLVPRTALRGHSQSSRDKMAKGLGYFSIALGVAEIMAPRAVCRAAGIRGLESVVRAYGAREIAAGVAILASHNPEPWIWGRVAGDMLDIATVATGLRQDNSKRDKSVLALTTLATVPIVAVICAKGLHREQGNSRSAIAAYSERSGFPQGL